MVDRELTCEFWLALCKEPHAARFDLVSGSVTGTLIATDAKQSAFHVSELATPLGVYPAATLRSSDVVLMDVEVSAAEASALAALATTALR
jgi:mannose/fructose/N-acetylgalactosamine-specific phosphotransferase system component IIC|tara:strand:- start:2314 stop:2586 length:273 start_codon:yes stop_codon:yes gene_type:complete